MVRVDVFCAAPHLIVVSTVRRDLPPFWNYFSLPRRGLLPPFYWPPFLIFFGLCDTKMWHMKSFVDCGTKCGKKCDTIFEILLVVMRIWLEHIKLIHDVIKAKWILISHVSRRFVTVFFDHYFKSFLDVGHQSKVDIIDSW